ncbi:NUAK family SNF1-like kinase 1 [Oncorhynchus kisutch]|nr:NUAK family SNF1-like kinase 1 [Oncorhynchus kisutch]
MVPTLPKKGILKNNQQRESGYYSSPERSESSELLGGSTSMAPPASSPTKRSMGRKGILKRNGKYGNSTSFHSGLSNMSFHGETPGDSGLSRSQSKPSSIVCEEMGLSSVPPLMGMDWSPSSPQPHVRACMSAEDLLQLAGFRRGLQTAAGGLHGGKVGTRGTPGSPGDDGSFSLLGDMDDMTQVYQHTLDISSNLT